MENILSTEKILKAVNRDESSIDLGSHIGRENEWGWTVEYKNRMKIAEDDETWSLVGETIERALIVQQHVDSSP